MAHKEEFPPLLSQGFHELSIGELKKLCVDKFLLSKSRPEIMAGFESLYGQAAGLGITGKIWVDGSFLTEKIEPGDIDFIFVVPSHFYDRGTPNQVAFLDWLIDNGDEPKKDFLCHTDLVLAYEPEHPEWPNFQAVLNHWERSVYGFSVGSREPKGIAVVTLAEGAK